MPSITPDKLAEIQADTATERVRTDYTGRGMFGRECLGVVVDGLGELSAFTDALAAALDEDPHELIDRAQSDQMGRRTIYYWPSIQVEGNWARDGDERDMDW